MNRPFWSWRSAALKLAGVNVKGEEGAMYDSQSNGLVESAVKGTKDAVRTNLACLVRRFGREFPGEHPILPCLLKYSVAMLDRCRMGPDGKTAFELRKERKFVRALPHFADKVLFRIPGVTKSVARIEPRWEDEFSLVCLTGNELNVGVCIRSGHSDVARPQNGLTTLSWMLCRQWQRLKRLGRLDVCTSTRR